MQRVRSGVAAVLATVACLCPASPGQSQTVIPPAGYIYSSLLVSQPTQSCVAVGPGVTFIGAGPGFTGAAQSILRLGESGAQEAVASGFNSIGDCVYDEAQDVLYVSDNALEAAGSVTGDTVFAIPDASMATSLDAAGLELAAAGSIPSASGLALDAAGALYVGDAVGAAAGRVVKFVAGVPQTLIPSGLEFVGGLAVEADGDLLVAESLPSFNAQVSRYDAAGSLVGVVSGPTGAHGSIDLRFNTDGRVLVTGKFGGDVVSLDPATGALEAFAGGLTFATGVDVDEFTGRVAVLSSTFSFPDPVAEDLSIHRFTPIERLVAGGGPADKNCIAEFYGVELVPAKPGKPAKLAICVDGAACDADGLANGSCLFPVGLCLAVSDPALPECSTEGVATFELKKVIPESAAMDTLASAIVASLPMSSATCAFSDGVEVPLGTTRSGAPKAGKGLIKIAATSADAPPITDSDTVRLRCLPE